MPRPPRTLKDGAYYHLIARANNRLFIFRSRRDFLFFKVLIRRAKRKYPFQLHHYCLMSNHIHLLIRVEEGSSLPRLAQYILHGYGAYYKKRTEYIGHLWQGRYKSLLIEKDSYLLQCGAYIERNPLRALMVKRLENYPWSSYAYYAKGVRDSLLEPSPLWEEFGNEEAERRRRYCAFVALENPYDASIDEMLIESCF